MNAIKRREQIKELLLTSTQPIPANQLAKQFSVSRQVIVGDIALLRAYGIDIIATPRGYMLSNNEEISNKIVKTIACKHGLDKLKNELYTIVDNGGIIIDVIVEHPVYGQLTGPLHLISRYDVDEFVKKVNDENVQPLSSLTDGIHLHTISCSDEKILERIMEELKKQDILL